MKKKKLTRKERIDKAKEELNKIITPEVLLEAEELAKQMRKISVEELYRQFTI
jgi:predicted metal-dependent phosphoesterase TrpH